MINRAIRYFLERFEETESKRNLKERRRRIGAELKFPLVLPGGRAAGKEKTRALWNFLTRNGWNLLKDELSGEAVGAILWGEMNEHRASCETGFCKVEFSLAHTDNLNSLYLTILRLKNLLSEFSREEGSSFLGFGLQPVTPPGKHLLMKKSRNIFWDSLFGGNKYIRPEDGTDVHLFTVSASSQVHLDVTLDETVDAINVFNGISGAQIAITANSNIWKGRVEPGFKSLGEIFWDWWLKDNHPGRYGVPERRFEDLEDYFLTVLRFPPVYIKRKGIPIALPHCRSLLDFYTCGYNNCPRFNRNERRCGLTPEGEEIKVSREDHDLDQHFTFFWHNARLSRYYTLENRVNDQQPPSDLMTIPALTLGIMERLDEAVRLIDDYPWEMLREMRIQACKHGLMAKAGGVPVSHLSRGILEIANKGLKGRRLGEETFLSPLWKRLEDGLCPADIASKVFEAEGPKGFVEKFSI